MGSWEGALVPVRIVGQKEGKLERYWITLCRKRQKKKLGGVEETHNSGEHSLERDGQVIQIRWVESWPALYGCQ